jgi:hypothetical protein
MLAHRSCQSLIRLLWVRYLTKIWQDYLTYVQERRWLGQRIRPPDTGICKGLPDAVAHRNMGVPGANACDANSIHSWGGFT